MTPEEARDLVGSRLAVLNRRLSQRVEIGEVTEFYANPQIRDSMRDSIAAYQDAIYRIDEGTFGLCMKCSQPILDADLRTNPILLYCSAEHRLQPVLSAPRFLPTVTASDELTRLLQQAQALLKALEPRVAQKRITSIKRSKEDLEDILRVSFESVLPATFTCNTWHEVWPPTRHGLTPSIERSFIQGKARLLDQIVNAVLVHSGEGGRFLVHHDRVILLRTGAVVARLVATG